MSDIEVNDDLDVFIDNTGDLSFVTGRDAFEQKIAINLIDFYQDVIGENDPDTALEQIKVGARRAVEDIDELDRVAQINAEYDDDVPDKINVDIIFDTGEELTFDL